MARITYRDFIRLFNFTPGTDDELAPWLSVREDGVYVRRPPDGHGLTHTEWLVITESMSDDFDVPEIRFPCSLDEFERFVAMHGLRGDLDESGLPVDEPEVGNSGDAPECSDESERPVDDPHADDTDAEDAHKDIEPPKLVIEVLLTQEVRQIVDEPAASSAGAGSCQPAQSWTVRKPKRQPGYSPALLRLLGEIHEKGQPRPTAREVIELWRNNPPQEVDKVLADSIDYYDAKGNTKPATLRAIAATIKRMTEQPPG